jgi:hypothetical protein
VVDKFRQLTDGVIEPRRQDTLVENVIKLEERPLTPAVTSPFEKDSMTTELRAGALHRASKWGTKGVRLGCSTEWTTS